MLGPEDIKKQQLDTPTVEQKTVETVEEKPVIGEIESVTHKRVAEVLGVDIETSEKFKREVSAITEWVRSKGIKDMNDIVWEVRNLVRTLGKSNGEPSINKAYRYVYLQGEKSAIEAELRRFETLKDGME